MCDYAYIYEFTNKINNKKYIGQTWNISRRIREHKKGYGNAKLLKAAFDKYGIDNFSSRIVFKTKSQDILDAVEIINIKLCNTLAQNGYGYNLALGGAHGKASVITKKLIGSYHKGKIVSKETRLKISKAHKDKKYSYDTIINISKGLIESHENKDKPIFIFDSLSHKLINQFKNIIIGSKQMGVIITKIYGSLSAKSRFKYMNKNCYASYINEPLTKNFNYYTNIKILTQYNEVLYFNSISDATTKLNIGKNVISALLRGLCKKSSFIDSNNKKVFFTAEYISMPVVKPKKDRKTSQETKMKFANTIKLRNQMFPKVKKVIEKSKRINPIFIFNCNSNKIVKYYDNVVDGSKDLNINTIKLYSIIANKSAFLYKEIKCYISYNNEPIYKNFYTFGRKIKIILENEILKFDSILLAADHLKINRSKIGSLLSKKTKQSKYIDSNGDIKYFNAEYDN